MPLVKGSLRKQFLLEVRKAQTLFAVQLPSKAPVHSSRPQNSPFPLSRHAVTAFQEIAGGLDEGCPKLGGISNTSEIAKKRDSENSNRVGKTCTHVLTYKS